MLALVYNIFLRHDRRSCTNNLNFVRKAHQLHETAMLPAAGASKAVAVVGLGTAGAATAVFLARQGYHVKLFEKNRLEEFKVLRGAGIGIQPIGLSVLKHLGILEPILGFGSRIDRLFATTASNRTVLDLYYKDFRRELYGLGLNRNVLFQELVYLAQSTPNIDIVAGEGVEAVESSSKAKPFVKLVSGSKEGPFDFVVVADGRSSIRRNMPVKSYEKSYPYGCLWASLPDVGDEFCSQNTLDQKLDSTHTMLGVLPTGKTHDMDPAQDKLVTLFWSVELSKLDSQRVRFALLPSYRVVCTLCLVSSVWLMVTCTSPRVHY